MASHTSNSVERDALRERERQARALLLEEMKEPPANPIFPQPIRVEPGREDETSRRIRFTLGDFTQVQPYLISDHKHLIGISSRTLSNSVLPPQPPPPPPSQGTSEKHQRQVAAALAYLDSKKKAQSGQAAPINGQRKPHSLNGNHTKSTSEKSKSHPKRPQPPSSSIISSSSLSSGSKSESKPPTILNGDLTSLAGQGDGGGSSSMKGAPKGGLQLPTSRRPLTPPQPPPPAQQITPQKPPKAPTQEKHEEEEADTAVESILQEMKLGIPAPLTAIETPRLETRFHFSPRRHQQNSQHQADPIISSEDNKKRQQYPATSVPSVLVSDGEGSKRRRGRRSPCRQPAGPGLSDSEEEFHPTTAPNGSGTERLQLLQPISSPPESSSYVHTESLEAIPFPEEPVRTKRKEAEDITTEVTVPKSTSAGTESVSAVAAKGSTSSSSSSSGSSSEDDSSSEEEEDEKPSIASSPERTAKATTHSWGLSYFLEKKAGSGSPILSKSGGGTQGGPDPSLVDEDSVNCILSKFPILDDCFSPHSDKLILDPPSVDSQQEEEMSCHPISRSVGYKGSRPPSPPASPESRLVLSTSSSPSRSPMPAAAPPSPPQPQQRSPPQDKRTKKKGGKAPAVVTKVPKVQPKQHHKQAASSKAKSKSYPKVLSSSSSDSSSEEVDVVGVTSPVKKVVQAPVKKRSKAESKTPPSSSVKSSSSSTTSSKKERKQSNKQRSSLSLLSNCEGPEAKRNISLPQPAVKVVVTPEEKECKENVVPRVLVSIQLQCLERVPPYPPQSRAPLRPEDSVIRQRTKRPHSPHYSPHVPSNQRLKKEDSRVLNLKLDRCAVSKSVTGDGNSCDRVDSVVVNKNKEEDILKNKLKKEKRKASDLDDKELPKKKPKKEKESERKRDASPPQSRLDRSPCGSLGSHTSNSSSHFSRNSLTNSSSKKESSSKGDRSKERRPKDVDTSALQAEVQFKEEPSVKCKEERNLSEQIRCKDERIKDELQSKCKEEKCKDEPQSRCKEERIKEDQIREEHIKVRDERVLCKEEQNKDDQFRSKEDKSKEDQIKPKEERIRDEHARIKEERVKDERSKDDQIRCKEERSSSRDGRSNKTERCKADDERKEERSRERSKPEKCRVEEPFDNTKSSRSSKEGSDKKGSKRREEKGKHKSHGKELAQPQQQLQAQSSQSERRKSNKIKDSNWEIPGAEIGSKASTSQETSGSTQSKEPSAEPQQHPSLPNGAHPATPTDCTLINNNSSSHHAWDGSLLSSRVRGEGDGASRTTTVEYDTRQHSSDYYMVEAKKLKHQADKEVDRTVQAMKYLEAVLYFIMTGNAMVNAHVDNDKVYTMYKETLSLIKHISSKFQKIQHSSAGSTDNKLAILSLRCQSLLHLQLYYLRKPEVKDLQRDLMDFHKSPAGKMASSQKSPASSQLQQPSSQSSSSHQPSSSSRCRLQQPSPHGKCVPSSPHSPTPSPAGSVASVGSQSSGYSSSELTGSTGRHSGSNGLVVSIPQNVYGMMQRQTSHLGNLQTCHDLWEQADYLMHRSHSKEFFSQLDHECMRLTLHSSVAELLHYVRKGLSLLKGSA